MSSFFLYFLAQNPTIIDYAISQTSLEAIFVKFAKLKQREQIKGKKSLMDYINGVFYG